MDDEIYRSKADRLSRKYAAVRDRVAELVALEDITPGQERELNDLVRAGEKYRQQMDELREERISAIVAKTERLAREGKLQLTRGDGLDAPPDWTPHSTAAWDGWNVAQRSSVEELRGRARTAVEHMVFPTRQAQERITDLVDRDEDGIMSRWAITAGNPHYESAFRKVVLDPQHGVLTWTEAERDAFEQVRALQRAMSLTDSAGGYMVPTHLDPAVLLTNDGTINPIRRIARVVTIASDTWNGVSSAGVTWSWDAEATEVSDDSPTLAQPSIPTHKAAGFIPFSIEVGMDAAMFTGEMQRLLIDGKERLEATAFATGSGSGQPTGIITALTGTGSVVASATTDTFAIADVYATIEALPSRFQPRAQWAANLAIINDIRQFATGSGPTHAFLADLGDGTPPRLLGKPLHEASEMDGTINATQDNYVLLVGDWSNYVVVDRVGTTIELVPHLFGTNRRPTGQRGLYAYARTGADCVVDQAFRLLNVT